MLPYAGSQQHFTMGSRWLPVIFLSVHILDYYFPKDYAIIIKIMPKGDRYGTYFQNFRHPE